MSIILSVLILYAADDLKAADSRLFGKYFGKFSHGSCAPLVQNAIFCYPSAMNKKDLDACTKIIS